MLNACLRIDFYRCYEMIMFGLLSCDALRIIRLLHIIWLGPITICLFHRQYKSAGISLCMVIQMICCGFFVTRFVPLVFIAQQTHWLRRTALLCLYRTDAKFICFFFLLLILDVAIQYWRDIIVGMLFVVAISKNSLDSTQSN